MLRRLWFTAVWALVFWVGALAASAALVGIQVGSGTPDKQEAYLRSIEAGRALREHWGRPLLVLAVIVAAAGGAAGVLPGTAPHRDPPEEPDESP